MLARIDQKMAFDVAHIADVPERITVKRSALALFDVHWRR
jgi:hypothetical protein